MRRLQPTSTLFPYTTLFRSEVECGVLGTLEGPPETSRPGEVRTGGDHEFYDFEAKYLADQHTEIDIDRKSTRLNSSHMSISYAVFCLKKKNNNNICAYNHNY